MNRFVLSLLIALLGAIPCYGQSKIDRASGDLPPLISFGHRYHIDEVGVTCLDCHPTYKKPTMEVCAQCHEGTGPDMPVIQCMKCHLRLDFGGVPSKGTF